MSRVKNKNSKIELILRHELWKRGIRYRKNYTKLPGKPDIVITKYRIVVFCDSEFWHGYDWENKKHEIHSNKDFWYKKIEGNIKRDIEVNEQLYKMGYTVIRFWGTDIKRDVNRCVATIIDAIKQNS